MTKAETIRQTTRELRAATAKVRKARRALEREIAAHVARAEREKMN